MPHATKSASFSSFKLSKDHAAHQPRAERDEWRAAERSELLSQIVIVTILAVLAIVGTVLIVVGLTR
jgi:hypothetical protein